MTDVLLTSISVQEFGNFWEKKRSNFHMDKKLDTLILRLEIKFKIHSILNTITIICYVCQ
jgi:hypothetical protein